MFIRTQSHKRKNGTSISGFALAESRRVDGQPRTFNLLNLGPDFKIPRELWKDFGKQVKAYLKGTASLESYEEGFRRKVIDTADQLEADGYDVHAKPNQRHWIIPEQMSHPDSRTVGGERVGLKALQLMGFAELLLELGLSQEQINSARVLVIGRMLRPGSEKKTHEWMCDESSITELLGCKPPSLSSLYRCSDRLHEHQKTITKRLFSNTKELLGFGDTILFYDLTNTYFHGRKQGELKEHGRRKEKRSDCPLVTLALTINEAGFPCNVDILPGNVGESKTLKAALGNLDVDGVTVIMDAGISTKENLAYLDQHGYAWITVDRRKKSPAPKRTPDKEFETTSGVQLRAWDLQSDRNDDDDQQHEESLEIQSDDEETIKEWFIYIHSEAKEGKEKAIMDTKCKKFEEALEDLHVGLSHPKRMKNFVLVEQKVGRLKNEF
ncbi:MAG: transposase, partial [Bacteroidetes bacterium]|nr:transposase [Bacteroidota bacterium]